MDRPGGDNGWDEWGKHVRMELERLSRCICTLQDTLNIMRSELAALKVQAGIWGMIAGLIPAAVAVLYILLKGGK